MTRRRINYRHYICIAITVGLVLLAVFVFPNALGRLIESFRDFGLSVAYSFCKFYRIEADIIPTVTEPAKIPFWNVPFFENLPTVVFPTTWADFKVSWVEYWKLWITLGNFTGYLRVVGEFLYYGLFVVEGLALIAAIVYIVFSQQLRSHNNNYNKDSKPLRAFKRLSKWCTPVRTFFVELHVFIREHKAYRVIWLCLWLFYLNIFSVIVEAFAYAIYFMGSLDFVNLYMQLYKLVVDISVPVKTVPVFVWVILAAVLIDCWRKRIGLSRLNHMEMKNRGFINAHPIAKFIEGTMGSKKTTFMTDFIISQEIMFRDKAIEKLTEQDMKFPHFPWINLEIAVKKAMNKHSVYNLATCKRFVRSQRIKFEKLCHVGRLDKAKCVLFDYDFLMYGYEYNDELKITNIWDVLENYVQLYFIYVIQTSLIISNYSVRVDNVISDRGNFPMWDNDLFGRSPYEQRETSRHSHILDYDMLRLGVKVIAKSKDSFEFGILAITEIGKERGNKFDLDGLNKFDQKANAKNDLFNHSLKMIRHNATVDNFPFVSFVGDDQRAENWSADGVQLCDDMFVKSSGETLLAMPFFALGELLYDWLFSRFVGLYYKYRYNRGDNTLLMYLLKSLTAWIWRYYSRIYNRFGYCTLRVQNETAKSGEVSEHDYYLMTKKIYSNRFSTDCFSDFFMERTLQSQCGIADIPEYKTEKASFDELQKQKSYFVNDLLNGLSRVKKKPGQKKSAVSKTVPKK